MMNDILPQHAASNHRIPSDLFMHPSHYDFKGSIDEEIKLLKEGYEWIEVKHEDVVAIREESKNSKNFGDCVEEILYKELAGYTGMADAHKLTEEKIFDMLHGDEDDPAQVKRKKVFESLYDADTKSTYYFIK